MVRADYKCAVCGFLLEREFQGMTLPPRVDEYCECIDDVSTYLRVWSPPSIGRVPDAGGSPSR